MIENVLKISPYYVETVKIISDIYLSYEKYNFVAALQDNLTFKEWNKRLKLDI